jgi:zinc transport system substrate-binding protein
MSKPPPALRQLALWLCAGGLLALGTACRPPSAREGKPAIATTTSYLEAAARDLLGTEISVLRLAEPGTCPGHFDMRPTQIQQLRQCRALLRFDFQKSLDAKLAGFATEGPRVVPVVLPGGMCRPDSYLTACRQLASPLAELGLVSHQDADHRLRMIEARIAGLSHDLTNRAAQAALARAPVLASSHQRDFCDWLGLRVVAEFRAADTAGVAEIEQAIRAGALAQVRLVIVNLPEGRRTADALAARLAARVVVFENFPARPEAEAAFDRMLRSNVERLLAAGAP